MKVNPAQLKRRQIQYYPFLGKVGKVISYTSIAVGPQGLHKHTPYLVGLVEFGKVRATLPLVGVDANKVQDGMKVRGILRRMREPEAHDVIVYGVKCIPLGDHET